MADYDAATALIVVDVQNDFADPAGSLSVARAGRILPRVNAEVAAAREALVNAARHAKVQTVSLYAEVEPDQLS